MNSIFENEFVRNFCENAGIKFEKPQPKSNEFSFQEFKKHMDRMVKFLELEDKINAVTNEFTESARCEASIEFPNQLDSVIDLLEYILHDEDDWIGYWLFELDCGKRYKSGTITEADGSDIPLATVEDLWNLLTKENKK